MGTAFPNVRTIQDVIRTYGPPMFSEYLLDSETHRLSTTDDGPNESNSIPRLMLATLGLIGHIPMPLAFPFVHVCASHLA